MIRHLLLLTLLFVSGCGSTDLDEQPTAISQPFELRGTWTGQYPPSEGDEGVELHFKPDFAWFIKDKQRNALQKLAVEQNGAAVRFTLTSETNPQNVAVFTGAFTNAQTMEGRYVNTFLDEDFDLTLVYRADLAP